MKCALLVGRLHRRSAKWHNWHVDPVFETRIMATVL
jgi:hypothetical protein